MSSNAGTQDLIMHAVNELGSEIPSKIKKDIYDLMDKLYKKEIPAKEVFHISPELESELYNYGYQLFQSGKYKLALGIFSFLRRMDPSDFKSTFAIAACHQHLHQFTEAAANYLICHSIDPPNPIPCFHLYDCFMQLHFPLTAWKHLEMVILLTEKEPGYSQLYERAILERNEVKTNLKNLLNPPLS